MFKSLDGEEPRTRRIIIITIYYLMFMFVVQLFVVYEPLKEIAEKSRSQVSENSNISTPAIEEETPYFGRELGGESYNTLVFKKHSEDVTGVSSMQLD